MSNLSDRQRSQEAKHAMDADTAFRVRARRNRLLGEWAADQKGADADATKAYAMNLVQLGASSDAALMERLEEDLAGIVQPSALTAAVATCEAEARRQIETA